MIKQFSS